MPLREKRKGRISFTRLGTGGRALSSKKKKKRVCLSSRKEEGKGHLPLVGKIPSTTRKKGEIFLSSTDGLIREYANIQSRTKGKRI